MSTIGGLMAVLGIIATLVCDRWRSAYFWFAFTTVGLVAMWAAG